MYLLEQIKETTLIKESPYSKVFIGELDDSSRVIVKLLKNARADIYRILTDMDSHYFPKIYELSEENESENGELIVIEEYIDGKTVSQLLNEKPFSREEIFRLMNQLCDAVSFLHGMEPPLIHRDLKPQNLILTKDDSLKIIDFNAARFYNPNADSDTLHLGTVEYAPPEQFGFSQTDVRSDIYCIGVILYEISYGKKFHQKTDRSSLTSAGLDAVIGRCTMYDPSQRYQSVEELQAALNKCRESDKYRKYRPLWFSGASVLIATALFALASMAPDIRAVPTEQMDVQQTEPSVGATIEAEPASTGQKVTDTEKSVRLFVTADTAEDTIAITFSAKADSHIYTFQLYDDSGTPVSVLELRYNHSTPRLLADRTLLRIDGNEFNASSPAVRIEKSAANSNDVTLTLQAQDIFGTSADTMQDFTWDAVSEPLAKLPAPKNLQWDKDAIGYITWNSPYPCAQFNYANQSLVGANNSYNSPDSPTFFRPMIGVIQNRSADYAVQVFALGDWEHGDSDPVMSEPFSYTIPSEQVAPVTEAWFQGNTVAWEGIENALDYEVYLYGMDKFTKEWRSTGHSRTASGTSLDIGDWIRDLKDDYEKLGVIVKTLSPDMMKYAAADNSEIFIYDAE